MPSSGGASERTAEAEVEETSSADEPDAATETRERTIPEDTEKPAPETDPEA